MLLLTLALQLSLTAEPAAPDFQAIWRRVAESHPALKARQADMDATAPMTGLLKTRWLPRANLLADGLATNDPTANLIYTLGQRRLAPADFGPTPLNFSDPRLFGRIGANVQLTLYDAGQTALGTDAARLGMRSAQLAKSAQSLELYVQTAKSYGELCIDAASRTSLAALRSAWAQLRQSYTLGIAGHALGKVGTLSLNTLDKQLQSFEREVDTNSAAQTSMLRGLTGQPDFTPQPTDPSLDTCVLQHISPGQGDLHAELQQANTASKQLEQSHVKARARPTAFAYAQYDAYIGSRNIGSAGTIGVGLRWEAYSPQHRLEVERASLQYAAANAWTTASAQGHATALDTLNSSIQQLQSLLASLTELEAAYDAEWANTKQLYTNGLTQLSALTQLNGQRLQLVRNIRLTKQQLLHAAVARAEQRGSVAALEQSP